MPQTKALVMRTFVNWRAAVYAGIIAAIVFALLEMIFVPLLYGGSPWAPLRMIGAIVMGRDVLPPPATFDLGVVTGAVIVHLILAIIYAFILAWIIAPMGTALAIVVGGVFGLTLYLINFYGFTAVFPWFAEARNTVTVLAHIIFGLVLAWSYKSFARHV